jgi:hypothetical protein
MDQYTLDQYHVVILKRNPGPFDGCTLQPPIWVFVPEGVQEISSGQYSEVVQMLYNQGYNIQHVVELNGRCSEMIWRKKEVYEESEVGWEKTEKSSVKKIKNKK